MKKIMSLTAAFLATTFITASTSDAEFKWWKDNHTRPDSARDVIVLASNDLGMHCMNTGIEGFIILPPANTIRAQVIERTNGQTQLLNDHEDVRVEYRLIENTDDNLKADPKFQEWIENAPKLGFLPAVREDGKIQSVRGTTLDGEMHAQPDGWWEVMAVPAFPDMSDLSSINQKQMTDPLGGPSRNPYLSAEIAVFDQYNDELLATTIITIPAAFASCLECHLEVAEANGFERTAAGSFEAIGALHERDSGINLAGIDPDSDGVPGPIRCSVCHLDPVFGTTPGYDGFPVSQYTLSNVIHKFHVESPAVNEMEPDIAVACYSCHPGNDANCYRGAHGERPLNGNNVWCTDCHGDLYQRVAEGQVDNPWSDTTLPTCESCHGIDVGEGKGWVNLGIFGTFVNSKGHMGSKVLCSTCHGAPHAMYVTKTPVDNEQSILYQGSPGTIKECYVCHLARTGTIAIGNRHD